MKLRIDCYGSEYQVSALPETLEDIKVLQNLLNSYMGDKYYIPPVACSLRSTYLISIWDSQAKAEKQIEKIRDSDRAYPGTHVLSFSWGPWVDFCKHVQRAEAKTEVVAPSQPTEQTFSCCQACGFDYPYGEGPAKCFGCRKMTELFS